MTFIQHEGLLKNYIYITIQKLKFQKKEKWIFVERTITSPKRCLHEITKISYQIFNKIRFSKIHPLKIMNRIP